MCLETVSLYIKCPTNVFVALVIKNSLDCEGSNFTYTKLWIHRYSDI